MEQEHKEGDQDFVAPETGAEVEQVEKIEGKFEVAGTEVNIGDRVRVTCKEQNYTTGPHTTVVEAKFEGVQQFGEFQHVMLTDIQHLDMESKAREGSFPIGDIEKVEIIK